MHDSPGECITPREKALKLYRIIYAAVWVTSICVAIILCAARPADASAVLVGAMICCWLGGFTAMMALCRLIRTGIDHIFPDYSVRPE